MVPRNVAHAYSRVNVETGVHAANPAQLVVMLYDGALKSLADVERHMNEQRIADKGQAMSRAIAIIDTGLRGSLNLQASPLAGQLEQLYEYMSRRLLVANMKNDVGIVREVFRLLSQLRGAWAELANSTQLATSPLATTQPAPAQRQPYAANGRV